MKEKRRVLLSMLRHLFVHNWAFKLVAVLLAVVLWAVLISQDTSLTRQKTFTEMTATVSGADTLKRNGFIVTSGLDSVVGGFTVTADVPQGVYSSATASNYSLRIDLSKITDEGSQLVKVSATSASAYGSVLQVEPEYVEINVEEYTTRYRIPVSLETTGNTPEGYYSATTSFEPSSITVSGPLSLVSRIVRAEATLDQSILPAHSGTIRSSIAFHLVDASGEVIDSDLVEITNGNVLIDSVIVEQTLYPSKEIDLNTVGLVTGTPAEGYEIKSISVTPSVITAAAVSDTSLSVLDSLFTESSVDVTDMAESFNTQIRIRKPSELVYLSPDSVTVAVEIGPVITSRDFSKLKISASGIGSGLAVSITPATASVTATGEQLNVDALKSADITLSVDVSGLEEGTYTLPVTALIGSGTEGTFTTSVSPAEVTVKIRTK